MAWLTINGIDASAIIGSVTPPTGPRRDIGNRAPAANGNQRVSRQARKYDLTVKTVPLTGAEAFAWEQLVIGEGQTWGFEGISPPRGFYSSKGMGPDLGFFNASIVAGTPKFGGSVLRLPATTGQVQYHAIDLLTGGFTIMVWRYESGVWHHYVVRNDGTSDGDRWKDGVHDNTLDLSTWLAFDYIGGSDAVTLSNASGSAQDYDGLTVLPFNVLDEWISAFYAATQAYVTLPNCILGGDVVRERVAPGRQSLATCADTIIMAKPGSGVLQRDMRYLDIVFEQV